MLTIPSPDNTTCHFALLIEHALCWRTIHSAFWDQPIKVEQRCYIGKAQIRSGNKNCGWSGAQEHISPGGLRLVWPRSKLDIPLVAVHSRPTSNNCISKANCIFSRRVRMGEQRAELEGGALLRRKAYLPANPHQAIQSGISKTNLYILLFKQYLSRNGCQSTWACWNTIVKPWLWKGKPIGQQTTISGLQVQPLLRWAITPCDQL